MQQQDERMPKHLVTGLHFTIGNNYFILTHRWKSQWNWWVATDWIRSLRAHQLSWSWTNRNQIASWTKCDRWHHLFVRRLNKQKLPPLTN